MSGAVFSSPSFKVGLKISGHASKDFLLLCSAEIDYRCCRHYTACRTSFMKLASEDGGSVAGHGVERDEKGELK